MSRPARDDEHARTEWHKQNLEAMGGTKEDVIRHCAEALAQRDKRIVDLERQLQSSRTDASRKHGCSFCGRLTCQGNCIK